MFCATDELCGNISPLPLGSNKYVSIEREEGNDVDCERRVFELTDTQGL